MSALLNVFFPKLCYSCSEVLSDFEQYVCTFCRHNLSVTDYHTILNNPVEKIFFGREKVEYATALLRFEKGGITQQLIHNLKYKNQQFIGVFLGKWLGEELAKTPKYKNIDAVIPVPLHKHKLKKRGYNQVALFGQTIATALQVPYYDDVLIKIYNASSQVTKNRLMRWNDKNAVFKMVNPHKITNKHLLLVDDIVTTGATLEACIGALKQTEAVKISIATIAIA